MKTPEYEFKKLGNGKVAFITKTDEATTTIETTVERAKNHYKEMIDGKQKLLNDLAKINKDLKDNEVVKNEEMEKFIQMANDANKYHKYQKLLTDRDVLLENLKMSERTIKDVETAMPEVKRMKK